ncbi:MAG: HIT domain-containing protein [candidate division WOR-3 bacterium]|nr:HIT domain-containing protein [candidate division WOR-3 bacterium]
MKTLWAPWRAEYIYCAGGQKSASRRHCLFCNLLKAKDDAQNLILYRGRRAFVVMNRFPYNNGHVMVAPIRHTANVETLSVEESAELFALVQKSLSVLRRALRPQGFNVGANLGRVAGAGVVGHAHIHVVPRWLGDVNFMPLLAETKVISEHLSETYKRLRRQFDGVDSQHRGIRTRRRSQARNPKSE